MTEPHQKKDRRDLTAREVQVLRLSALGHPNKDIASQLGVSVRTVEAHKAKATQRLGLKGRVDLIRFATRQGWIHQ